MELDFFWIGIGIAAFGYFIGEGLKNFGNSSSKGILQSIDEYDEGQLVKESDLHWYLNISKEDAKRFVLEHPTVPHLKINGNVYFSKKKLQEWLSNMK